MMNIKSLSILFTAVLGLAVLAPKAEARDHRRDKDRDRHEHRDRHDRDRHRDSDRHCSDRHRHHHHDYRSSYYRYDRFGNFLSFYLSR